MNTLPIECKIHIFEYLYKSSLKNVYISSKENKQIIDKYIELKNEQFIVIINRTGYEGKSGLFRKLRDEGYISSLPIIPIQVCDVNIEIEFERNSESDSEKENKKRMKYKKIKPKLQKKLDKRKNYIFSKRNSKRKK